jgi:hypothetical protein
LALLLGEPGTEYQRRRGANREISVNGKWRKVMLMSAAMAAWLVYDMASATETPRQGVAILQYCLPACALIGLVGSLVMAAWKNDGNHIAQAGPVLHRARVSAGAEIVAAPAGA